MNCYTFYQVVAIILVHVLSVCISDSLSQSLCHTPQYLELGQSGIIKCNFNESFYGVFWYDTINYTSRDPIVHYHDGERGGAGLESGHLDILDDGSLLINNVTLRDEGHFTVVKLQTQEGGMVETNIKVIVIDPSKPPIISITGCSGNQTCRLNRPYEGTLTCSVSNIQRPIHLDWNFVGNYSDVVNIATDLVTVRNDSNTFNITQMMHYTVDSSFSGSITFRCTSRDFTPIALTKDVNVLFHIDQEEEIIVQPTDSKKALLVLLVLPSFIAACCAVHYIRKKRRRNKKGHKDENEMESQKLKAGGEIPHREDKDPEIPSTEEKELLLSTEKQSSVDEAVPTSRLPQPSPVETPPTIPTTSSPPDSPSSAAPAQPDHSHLQEDTTTAQPAIDPGPDPIDEETVDSFDALPQTAVLTSPQKQRVKPAGNRRPPTRRPAAKQSKELTTDVNDDDYVITTKLDKTDTSIEETCDSESTDTAKDDGLVCKACGKISQSKEALRRHLELNRNDRAHRKLSHLVTT